MPDFMSLLMRLAPRSIEDARRDDARYFAENPGAVHRVRARALCEFPEDPESIGQVCVLRPGAEQPAGSPPLGVVVYQTALPGMTPVRLAMLRVVGNWVATKSCARAQGETAAGADANETGRGRDEHSG